MSAETPPDGLTERQIIAWFRDQPKREAERQRKEQETWNLKEAERAKKAAKARKREKLKDEKKMYKQKAMEKKRAAKKRLKEKELKEKEERKKRRKGKSAGFAAMEYDLSPALAAVCGVKKCSRPQVVKKIWEYVRANELQNPKDKREILCDSKMKKVMDNKKSVTMFAMNKYLGKHLIGGPVKKKVPKKEADDVAEDSSSEDGSSSSSEEESSSDEEEDEDEDDGGDGPKLSELRKCTFAYLKSTDLSKITNKTLRKHLEKKYNVDLRHRKEYLKGVVQDFLNGGASQSKKRKAKKPAPRGKKQKTKKTAGKNNGGGGGGGAKGGFATKEYTLSEDLSGVCGCKKLSRPQVVKKLWEYIKANELQNPENKREILCDTKFKKVMGGRKKVTMFEMNKYVGPHLSDA